MVETEDNKMKVLIDADGCPVVKTVVAICRENKVPCHIICDTSHIFDSDYAKVRIVSKGADSADFAIVNTVQRGDIVITQDYGLAAMCLAKGAVPINQNGLIYNDDNIGTLLNARYTAKKIRMSGGRLKGPSRRTAKQDSDFEISFRKLIENNDELAF